MGDLGYSLFCWVAAGLVWMHITKLRREREVKGVHWAPILFTWVWSLYSIWFFWSEGMYWTLAANFGVVFSYSIWLSLIARYWRRKA